MNHENEHINIFNIKSEDVYIIIKIGFNLNLRGKNIKKGILYNKVCLLT